MLYVAYIQSFYCYSLVKVLKFTPVARRCLLLTAPLAVSRTQPHTTTVELFTYQRTMRSDFCQIALLRTMQEAAYFIRTDRCFLSSNTCSNYQLGIS
jgi:hypothetical protein